MADRQVELAQWLTPPTVARAFWDWSNIREHDRVLEPAAGEGALIPLGRVVTAVELDPERAEELRYWRPDADVLCTNFLELPAPEVPSFDVAIENPPYNDSGEGLFIERALHWAPRVCALVRSGALHGGDRFEVCWSKPLVGVTRVAYLKHRPKFLGPMGTTTKFTPAYDYAAIEVVRDYRGPVELTWVDWR